jgi:hypothetical protein
MTFHVHLQLDLCCRSQLSAPSSQKPDHRGRKEESTGPVWLFDIAPAMGTIEERGL